MFNLKQICCSLQACPNLSQLSQSGEKGGLILRFDVSGQRVFDTPESHKTLLVKEENENHESNERENRVEIVQVQELFEVEQRPDSLNRVSEQGHRIIKSFNFHVKSRVAFDKRQLYQLLNIAVMNSSGMGCVLQLLLKIEAIRNQKL